MTMKSPISQFLITIGVVLVLAGLLWPVLNKTGLGRLPGDIVVEKENFRFYFPLTSSIIVSLILTVLFWLFRR
jgi:ribose/xylose/arabinose/galactoside ABC-type transport system permease subunit